MITPRAIACARIRIVQVLVPVVCLVLAHAAENSAMEQGLAAFRRRDFRTARQCFETAVRLHPRRALGYKLLGMTFSAEQNDKAALEPYRRACSLDAREENAC